MPSNRNTPARITDKDQRLIAQMFLAGWSAAEIAETRGLTAEQVHGVIAAQLRAMADRYNALSDQADTVYVERLEVLIKATWPMAMKGDLKAIETARKLLEQQARVFDVVDDEPGMYDAPLLQLAPIEAGEEA